MSAIPERLAALRTRMREHGVSHYLVPSSDEHLNEYLPEWRQRREYASGFTGSAGDLLVGLDDVVLFTDGRYHLQAESQLAGSTISLSKVGVPGQPTLAEHAAALARGSGAMVIGFDPMVFSVAAAESLAGAVAAAGGELRPVTPNLVDLDWSDRPQPSHSSLVPVRPEWCGATAAEKLAAVRAAAAEADADAVLIVKTDQLAWLLNLRSKDDIPYNPVFEGYGLVTADALHVFLHSGSSRLPGAAGTGVPGLAVHDYGVFTESLPALASGLRVLVDPSGSTLGQKLLLESGAGTALVLAPSPVEHQKGIKNAAEQASMRRANRLASLAKTRALAWLEEELRARRPVTEKTFLEEIERQYAALDDYWGLSFNTISAAGANGAIMHYAEAGDVPLSDGEMFLIDSGVQVAGGTTDDTRTVAVGAASDEQRRHFTLVLKAHIAAASLVFPAGTAGSSIDATCRGPMWRAGLNFDHGTGHGVGCFLNVHEGPFAISESARKPHASTPLREGMVTSIEPGYYRPGWGGIRIENLYLILDAGRDDAGRQRLRFEPLTFVPLDERLIDRGLLTPEEVAWLDAYQARVNEELGKETDGAELAALGLAAGARP